MAAPLPLPPPVTNTVRPFRLGWMESWGEFKEKVSRGHLVTLQNTYQSIQLFSISIINMP